MKNRSKIQRTEKSRKCRTLKLQKVPRNNNKTEVDQRTGNSSPKYWSKAKYIVLLEEKQSMSRKKLKIIRTRKNKEWE